MGGAGGMEPAGPFTVGGIVKGLIGTGLVLQNNGGDDVSPMQNGAFTFATALANGSTFGVTVSASPQNPAQTCTVMNGDGTIAGANVVDVIIDCKLVDSDNDKVPDMADPFPNDPTKPQRAKAGLVYPHTASTLFTMDASTYAITQVGNFNGATYSGSMTDLAIDQYGVLYGVTFGELFTCDAQTATCYRLATLPQSFNGLTMLPPGTLHPFLDTLVCIANSGDWYKVTLNGAGSATLTQFGAYGSGYTSSGDAFSIDGVGTFAAVDAPGKSFDVIVSVDPLTGKAIAEIGQLNGYSSVYGLAGALGQVFGFDASGAVLKVDTMTGATSVLAQTGNPWWGAGVATRLLGP